MKWSRRLGEEHDLEDCVRLLAPYQLLYGEAGHACLPEFLQFLFRQRAVDIEVWYEGQGRRGKLIAFDVAVFISENFAEGMFHGPPFIARQVLELFLQDRLPILTPRAAYLAHEKRQLSALHLFAGVDSMDPEFFRILLDRATESYYQRMRGIFCRRIFGEAYGPLFAQWCKSSGYLIANDYSQFFQRFPEATPPAEIYPTLMVATKEEADRNFGSRVAPMFRHVVPRFGFAPSEQMLLRYALDSETDDELAASLDISVWTVKKRWRQIYDRVLAVDAEILAGGDLRTGELEKSRGTEMRRHLLGYLREHFEELCAVEQWKERGPEGETLRRGSAAVSPTKS